MNVERIDNHIQAMREFHIAEVKDSIAERQQDLDEAVARGDERGREFYENSLASLQAMLRTWQAQQRAA